MTRSLAVTLNALGLYAVALVLAAAFAAQLLLDELPCPLCLLQRIQFALLAVGPVLNVRFGPRPSHYAASLLVAAAGAAFASRQILLHIMPGDPGYVTGPCIEHGCFDGLACLSDLCVDPNAGDDEHKHPRRRASHCPLLSQSQTARSVHCVHPLVSGNPPEQLV